MPRGYWKNTEQSLAIEPVNLIQAAYFSVALLGCAIAGANPQITSLRILLLLAALLMLFNMLEEAGITRDFYLITPVFPLGFGPAFYLFSRQLVYGNAPSIRQLSRHLCPMLLAIPFTHWPYLVIAIGTLSTLTYLCLSLLLIRRYHRVVDHSSAAGSQVTIFWLKYLFIAYAIAMVQDLARINLLCITKSHQNSFQMN